MRIGLIGAGYMAGQHADAWAALDDVEVVAVVSRRPERAKALAQRLGAVAGHDPLALLDDARIDAVDVTYPTRLHPEICVAALRAGKHTLCETPLAQSAAEGELMLAAARDTGRHLQVALMMRFARPAIDLHAELRAGSLGPLREVALKRLAPGTGGAHHGDALEELMLFDLDTLRRCLGRPDLVRAKAERGETGHIDRALATLEFGDARATCEASYLQPEGEPFTATLEANFELGRLSACFRMPVDALPTLDFTRTEGEGAGQPDGDLGPQPILAECRRFADVVHGEADPALLDASEAVESLRVLDALRASCATGAWITLRGMPGIPSPE